MGTGAGGSFDNIHGEPPPRLSEVFRWQWQRLWRRLPPPPRQPVETAVPDLAAHGEAGPPLAATWLGHATVLLRLDGVNILTDPVFDRRVSPLPWLGPPRHRPPPLALAALPPIDVVVISHSHYDHLSLATLRSLYRQDGGAPRFLVPLGIDRWFRRHVAAEPGDRVRALGWWDRASLPGLELTLVPVQHWSSRTPWDTNTTLWGAWALRASRHSFFFAGDLGYSPDIAAIAAHFDGFDLAAIPIGAYEPRWLMQRYHLTPEDAVRVHREIGARQSIAIHWGTYEGLTDEALDEPPRLLAGARRAAGMTDAEFVVLPPGATLQAGSHER